MYRYIVFDVETPNRNNNRMSAIGIAVIEDGVVSDEWYSLIDPETHFDYFNTRLTGIDEMIKDGVISEIHLHKWCGAEISDEKSSSARVAAFIASDDDKNVTAEKKVVIADLKSPDLEKESQPDTFAPVLLAVSTIFSAD